MIISISGPAGSGKSTIAKMLEEKLGWKRYYIGGLRRKKAFERGLTLEEYNKLGETDPSTDREIDEYQRELGKQENNFIIEGRTSWYFIPHSVKIYIDVDSTEGARRVLSALKDDNNRNEGKNLQTLQDVLRSHQDRKQSDIFRYRKYYQIDVYDKNNYEFVINTSGLSREEAFSAVWDYVMKKITAIGKN
jgi:cytidylate kinase